MPQRYSSKPPVSHSPVPQGWPHHPSLGCSPLCPPSVPLLRLPFRLALPKLALLPPATAVPGSIWHLSAEEKGFLWCQEEITAAPAPPLNKERALPACSSPPQPPRLGHHNDVRASLPSQTSLQITLSGPSSTSTASTLPPGSAPARCATQHLLETSTTRSCEDRRHAATSTRAAGSRLSQVQPAGCGSEILLTLLGKIAKPIPKENASRSAFCLSLTSLCDF